MPAMEGIPTLDGWRAKRTEIQIALASFVFSCAWFLIFNTGGFGAGYEAPAVARSLIQTGKFANPFPIPTGPTAHIAPLFPAFLALLMFLFRTPEWIVIAAVISAAAATAVFTASLPTLSSIFVGRRQPGIYAAYFAIVIPVLPLFLNSDANFTAALVGLFTITAKRLSNGSRLKSLLLGMFAGLITLLNPVATIAAFCSFSYLIGRQGNLRRFLPIFTLGLSLMVSPWIYRNWLVFNRFIPVRDNLGLELSVYNSERLGRSHPLNDPAEALTMRAVGEAAYWQAGYSKAFAWIKLHPKEFIHHTASRVVQFWFPSGREFGAAGSIYWISAWLLTFLAIPGIRFVRQRSVLVSTLALYPLVFYVTLAMERYRLPITWVLLVPAGTSLEWLLRRVRAIKADVVEPEPAF